MANKKYTELPQANAITGAEILAIVQDGGSVQGDIDLIKAYFDTLYAPSAQIGVSAWVNFSASGGVITVRASHNVTSVTRNATGDYTVAFTNALASANYVVSCSFSPKYGVQYGTNANMFTVAATTSEQAPTTGGFRLTTSYDTVTAFDPKYVMIMVVGG